MFVASKITSNRTFPDASRARRGKAFMARDTVRTPSTSSIISSSSNPQEVPLNIRGATSMAPAPATPTAGAVGRKTALKAVVTGIESASPGASTEKDDDYVYIRVRREKRRCSTMFLRALGRKMPHQSFTSYGVAAGTRVAAVTWLSLIHI